jgi:hypothetical protein
MGIEKLSVKDDCKLYARKMLRISIVNSINLLSFPIRKRRS